MSEPMPMQAGREVEGEALPARMPLADGTYSNYDHAWDEGVRDAVDSGEFCATHAAWNFNGKVWRDEHGYHEEVWQYHNIVAVVTEETLDELIESVNAKYGHD